MSAKNESIVRSMVDAIRNADKAKTSPYDTQATVRRVENGVAWVHIPGGVDETPVKLTIAAKPGDNVQVRVSGGRAFLVGNASAPPTDDRTANAIGQNLTKRIDTTNGVLNGVRKVVESVRKIAANTNQYFWHTEEGEDTGAHITEIPQEAFLKDPEHGGGNLLARSNGIAIRDGLTELSQFSANGLDVYGSNYNTSTQEYEQVEIAHLGYGEGSGSSGTAKAPYFTFGIRVGNKGNYSVAEGLNTRASGYCAHAEGNDAQATGNLSHAECRAIASGFESHAEGDESASTGIASHAEGYFTHAYGNYSHAQNYHTRANGDSQTVIGKYNAEDTTSAFIIGNGTGESNRHNALKVDWDGNLECKNHKVGCVERGTDGDWTYYKYDDGYFDAYIRVSVSLTHYITSNGFYGYNTTLNLPAGCVGATANSYSVFATWKIGTGFAISSDITHVSASQIKLYGLGTASGTNSCVIDVHVHGKYQ